MNNLTELTYDSINKYFKKLTYTGYLNTSDTNKILILSFIEELMSDKFSYFIDEEDYGILLNALDKLYGSNCIIGMPSYDIYNSISSNYSTPDSLRSIEIGNSRFSENNIIRIEV